MCPRLKGIGEKESEDHSGAASLNQVRGAVVAALRLKGKAQIFPFERKSRALIRVEPRVKTRLLRDAVFFIFYGGMI